MWCPPLIEKNREKVGEYGGVGSPRSLILMGLWEEGALDSHPLVTNSSEMWQEWKGKRVVPKVALFG